MGYANCEPTTVIYNISLYILTVTTTMDGEPQTAGNDQLAVTVQKESLDELQGKYMYRAH